MTEAEYRLWYHLRLRQMDGYMFRRQAPMKKYVVDFICHKARLIIEVDGGQHAVQKLYDDQRTVWLESQGYQVLRFWNNEVMENLDGVVETILANLSDQSSSTLTTSNILRLRHKK